LKLKTFISQKSLDTPLFRLIRFRQKVLTDILPPLELFSLEEEAAQLPGGLFVFALQCPFFRRASFRSATTIHRRA
jgi:hypothetical protein